MTVRLTVIIPIISNNAIHLVISEYSYQLNNESSIILALFLFARRNKSLICSRSVGHDTIHVYDGFICAEKQSFRSLPEYSVKREELNNISD